MQNTATNWLNEWLDVYVKPCKKENTYLCYKYIVIMTLKHRSELEHLSLSDIDELYLQKLLNEFALIYARSSIKKVITVFRGAYNAALRNGKCSRDPTLALIVPTASEKEIRALTREEEECVIAAAHKDILGHITIFFLDTGIRSIELRNLKWADYNSEKNENPKK